MNPDALFNSSLPLLAEYLIDPNIQSSFRLLHFQTRHSYILADKKRKKLEFIKSKFWIELKKMPGGSETFYFPGQKVVEKADEEQEEEGEEDHFIEFKVCICILQGWIIKLVT